MSVETKELQEKLERARRLLQQMPDEFPSEGIKAYIEELEAKLLLIMSKGPRE
jgi:hypothetical protein